MTLFFPSPRSVSSSLPHFGQWRSSGAWEVVVWGSSKYSVFIVPAPTNATYAGVTGFVKAIFRWNAPPAMTIKIGQIGGGQTVQSHTGMMNAAPKVVAGTVAAKVHLAGLLAFTSATTNNISVNVDFASWERKADSNPLVLGNVAGSPPYSESVFFAVERPDGLVDIRMRDFYTKPETSALHVLDEVYYEYLLRYGPYSAPPYTGRRCAGALLLNSSFGVPVPAGKCDDFLKVAITFGGTASSDHVVSSALWTSAGINGTAAFNSKMTIEPYEATNPVATYKMCIYDPAKPAGTPCNQYPILSETYVSTWDAPY